MSIVDLGQLSAELNRVVRDLLAELEQQRNLLSVKSQLEGLHGLAEAATQAFAKTEAALARLGSVEAGQAVLDQILQSAILESATGHPSTTNYANIYDGLDVCVVGAGRGVCSETLPLRILETLFESESVQGAERIFSYVESRSDKLTNNRSNGKAKPPLALLRMCNELLRRLSKSIHTVFCGRILMFLSASFPLGDQSSVNLRGAYNANNVTALFDPVWNMAEAAQQLQSKEEAMEIDAKTEDNAAIAIVSEDVKMAEGSTSTEIAIVEPTLDRKSEGQSREKPVAAEPDFYTLFWGLQKVFAYPPSLLKTDNIFPEFRPPPSVLDLNTSTTSASSRHSHSPSRGRTTSDNSSKPLSTSALSALPTKGSALPLHPNLIFFKYAVGKVLHRFAELNKKDKNLEGNSSSRKHRPDAKADMAIDADDVDAVKEHYFFPKFLTSRNLLDLELADSTFRRQVMVQILVTIGYLRNHGQAEKEKAAKSERFNKTLLLPATLGDVDLEWISKLSQRAHMELRDTPPDGERFQVTISVILARDQQWINWKLASCKDFVQPPLDNAVASEDARAKKRRLLAPSRPFPFALGSPGLSNLWKVNNGDPLDLSELKNKQPFVNFESAERQTETNRLQDIENLRERMQDTAAQLSQRRDALTIDEKEPSTRQLAENPDWRELDDQQTALAWRRLRLVATEDLAYFNRIKNGDVVQLFENIEAAKAEAEKAAVERKPKLATESTPTTPVVAEAAETQDRPEAAAENEPVPEKTESSNNVDADVSMAEAESTPAEPNVAPEQ